MSAKFQRTTQRFLCYGLDLNAPVDAVPPGYYPALQNVRSYTAGTLQPRQGLTAISTVVTTQTPVHSIRRLNDPKSGSFRRILGAGTALAYGTSTFTQASYNSVPIVLSGNPLSMIPYRPDQSPSSWMYVADSAAMYKIVGQNAQSIAVGTVHQIGLPAPVAPPTVELAYTPQPMFGTYLNFQALGSWTGDNTVCLTASLLFPDRINTTTVRVLYDGGINLFGWCSVVPTAITNIGPGAQIDWAGFNSETTVVYEVYPGSNASTVASILYDNSPTNTGLCTIQPTASLREIRRNAVVLLNGAVYARVVDSTIGPDGSVAFRVSTGATTISATQSLQVVASFRTHTFNTMAVIGGDTLKQKDLNIACVPPVAQATGYIQNLTAIDLTKVVITGGTTQAISDDDYFHLSFKCSDLSKIIQARVMFNCDATDTTFAQNYYYRAFTPNDLIAAAKGTQTALGNRTTIIQNQTISTSRLNQGGSNNRGEDTIGEAIDQRIRNHIDRRTDTDPNAPPTTQTPRSQTGTGDNQWSEVRFKRADLVRVGTAKDRGFANITGFRLEAIVAAGGNPTLDINSLTVWGNGGPDAGDIGAPYMYRYRYRVSTTGARSNWSPAPFEGVVAYRHDILVTPTNSAIPEVDKIDVERFGGVLTDWIYVGSVNNNSASGFLDKLGDDAVVANASVSEDDGNYQPWPTRSIPFSTTANTVCGTAIQTSVALPTNLAKGSTILVNGTATSFRQTISASAKIYEIADSLGTQSSVTVEIPEPILTSQPLPALWGPFNGRFFACGDTTNPGTLYWTNGNDPDAVAETNYLEITSTSDPLQNGCVFNGRCYVFSAERLFQIEDLGGGQFIYTEVPGSRGLVARWALTTGDRIWFLAKDGIYQTAGGDDLSITNATLRNLFAIEGGVATSTISSPDYAQKNYLRLAYYDGFLYFDYKGLDGHLYTLVYTVTSERPGWWLDTYAPSDGPGIVCHYGEEGDGVHSLLLGGADATTAKLYQMGGTADGPSAIAWSVTTPYYNADDRRANKLWGDYIVDADPNNGTVNVAVKGNEGSTTFTVAPTSFTGAARNQFVFDINAGAGTEARTESITLSGSSTTAVPKLYLYEPSYIVLPELSALRATYWEDLGYPGDKYVQGIEIVADTKGATRSIQVQYDQTSVGDTLSITHNGNLSKAYSFSVPIVARELRLMPLDAQPDLWEQFTWKWIWEPEPSAVYHWETQQTANQYDQFQSMKAAYITLRSTTAVTFTITRTDDGQQFTYTIPSTANVRKKVYVPLAVIKGKAFTYALDSGGVSTSFRLYKDDCVVLLKPWASEQAYAAHNPFGTPHGGGQVKF